MVPKILKAVVNSVRDWEKERLTVGNGGKQFGVSMI